MRRTRFRYPVTTLAGSSLKNFAAVTEGFHVEPQYWQKYLLSRLAAGILEPFNVVEQLLWKNRINSYNLKNPPVFIIGFWRSGTTLLHNLMCQDPEAAFTSTFQTVFPNLMLTQSWWLKPLVNNFLPARRPYDNVSMDMDFPQEEDFGLMNMQPTSIYKFFLFPADFDRIVREDLFPDQLTPERLGQWKAAYREMIMKAIHNTGGSRYIGKNPCHLTRTPLLREMFPGAKFIFIHRHPYKAVESMYQFVQTIFPGVQLQDVPPDFSREKIVILYKVMMEAFLEERKAIPSSEIFELRMSDFVRDIPGHLSKVYQHLRLGDFSKVSGKIEKFMTENPYPVHYSHPPGAMTAKLVDQFAPDIMDRLGYSKSDAGTALEEHSDNPYHSD